MGRLRNTHSNSGFRARAPNEILVWFPPTDQFKSSVGQAVEKSYEAKAPLFQYFMALFWTAQNAVGKVAHVAERFKKR
jgi:hypothetical protein